MAKALARFTIESAGEGYRLHIEDDGGAILEIDATPEQLDLIAEAIDERLAAEGEEFDAADDDAEES